jgi:hypothetical protein
MGNSWRNDLVVGISVILRHPFQGTRPARNPSRIRKQCLANLRLSRRRSLWEGDNLWRRDGENTSSLQQSLIV